MTLISPKDGDEFSGTKVELRYVIRSHSKEPLTALKVLIDGHPTEQRVSPELVTDKMYSVWITIPPRDVAISLIVENRYATSEPATVHLRWRKQQ